MTNTKNYLIVTKRLVINETNEIKKEGIEILCKLIDKNITPLLMSKNIENFKNKLINSLPEEYKNKVTFMHRNKENKNKIQENKGKYLFSILAFDEMDAIYSFHTKIPMFYFWELHDELSDKITTYGLPIHNIKQLISCYESYNVEYEPYFNTNFGNQFQVVSLYNANTYSKPENEMKIKTLFQSNIKESVNKAEYDVILIVLFNFIKYFFMNNEFSNYNYIGSFPSSKTNKKDTTINFIQETIRTMNNLKPRKGKPLLIRNKDRLTKHRYMNKDRRITDQCNSDLETMIINKEVIKKLEGENVIIIDDYITSGFSAETAKNLLLSCGVNKVLFISFGKFGMNYNKITYQLNGDLTNNGYQFEVVDNESIMIKTNPKSDQIICEYLDIYNKVK